VFDRKRVLIILRKLLFLLSVFLCARAVNCEELKYLYKAVIKVPVANVYERPDGNTALHTQALLNEEINVISETSYFVFARVPDGYRGYINKSNITNDTSSLYASGDKVIVKSIYAVIFDFQGTEIYRAPMTSIFYGEPNGDKYRIALPQNKAGYIHKSDAMVVPRGESIPTGSRESFAAIAKLFVNTRYLWGGCSWNGMDCSGLTYIAAKMNGITIPRDSLPQSTTGVYINLKDAIAGDQLFFSSDERKSIVSHTGIYLGNGDFIHSTTGGVGIININSSNYYRNRFLFAKRLSFR
jgi:hypothetical protein